MLQSQPSFYHSHLRKVLLFSCWKEPLACNSCCQTKDNNGQQDNYNTQADKNKFEELMTYFVLAKLKMIKISSVPNLKLFSHYRNNLNHKYLSNILNCFELQAPEVRIWLISG